MAEFKIDTAPAGAAAGQLRGLSRELNDLYARVEGIRAAVDYRTLSIRNLMLRLSQADRRILEQAANLDTLAEALDTVIGYYVNTERAVLAGSDSSTSGYSAQESAQGIGDWFRQRWEDARNALREWGIIPAERQTRTEGVAVTAEQQQEMDRYMQQQIESVRRQFRYSRLNWALSSMEERQAILNDYLQEVATILGLTIGEINFFHNDPQNGYVLNGYYDPDAHCVSINTWSVSDECFNSYSIMQTIVHEMRHAYQTAVVNNPDQFVVTEETMNQWQESMDNYMSTEDFMENEGMSRQDAFRAYEDQAIERDARAFSGED